MQPSCKVKKWGCSKRGIVLRTNMRGVDRSPAYSTQSTWFPWQQKPYPKTLSANVYAAKFVRVVALMVQVRRRRKKEQTQKKFERVVECKPDGGSLNTRCR